MNAKRHTLESFREVTESCLALIVAPKGRDLCEECGGSGSTGTPDRYTDQVANGGDVQWRGYLPTTWCAACEGTGVWPTMKVGGK